ncbi:uncharacterized protein HMPREF1541_09431 [Cyphellophora europaea CBS 101466]|uniref:Uncharacterized protein n=1 Tax=Cyphellophora europaea (strain CBS 101466) TaxID=1220924 RepID=W2SCE3_CYPE1|nr:uncharacterized protein HMPREF1541_09431 [Cyphellophora europaea CBS 101466]ETN45599.1 hypothetical protein HMPREF1541_09431 [Cyphellophora europaea CBS 101466]
MASVVLSTGSPTAPTSASFANLTTTMTVNLAPFPAPSDAIPINDTLAAYRRHYQPIFNIDYPGQDALPWIWAPNFDECLHRCDMFNAKHLGNGTVLCKAALFAPSRINGLNDCYLKLSLNNPQRANLTLIGGVKLACNETSISVALPTVSFNSTYTSSMTPIKSFQTNSINPKPTSSSSKSDTGRPSITFSSSTIEETPSSSDTHTRETGLTSITLDSSAKSAATTSSLDTSPTTSPHAIEASHLTPPLDSEPAVLTVPTTVHTHKI